MAATRLIALHVNKGKTVAQCLSERLDYSQNPIKTKKGELITSYACQPETAATEFLLSKRQYQQITGEEYKGNSVEYKIYAIYETNSIYDGGAVLARITDAQREAIAQQSNNNGYSGMYVSASDYSACKLLVKSSARTATRNKRTWRLSANGSS